MERRPPSSTPLPYPTRVRSGAGGTATGVKGEDLAAGLNLGATFTDYPGGTANWSFSGGTNYNDQSGSVAIVINKAALDIYAVSDSKGYDGSTTSGGVPTVDTSELKNSDTVTGLSQAFQSKNVMGSNGSTLAVSGYSVNDGNAGANYAVTTHTASGTI